jgi:hypothetical protein
VGLDELLPVVIDLVGDLAVGARGVEHRRQAAGQRTE